MVAVGCKVRWYKYCLLRHYWVTEAQMSNTIVDPVEELRVLLRNWSPRWSVSKQSMPFLQRVYTANHVRHLSLGHWSCLHYNRTITDKTEVSPAWLMYSMACQTGLMYSMACQTGPITGYHGACFTTILSTLVCMFLGRVITTELCASTAYLCFSHSFDSIIIYFTFLLLLVRYLCTLSFILNFVVVVCMFSFLWKGLSFYSLYLPFVFSNTLWFETKQLKFFCFVFYKSWHEVMNMLNHFSKCFTGYQSKKR